MCPALWSDLHILSHWLLVKTLWRRYHYFHFVDEETGANPGQVIYSCPQPWWVAESISNPVCVILIKSLHLSLPLCIEFLSLAHATFLWSLGITHSSAYSSISCFKKKLRQAWLFTEQFCNYQYVIYFKTELLGFEVVLLIVL